MLILLDSNRGGIKPGALQVRHEYRLYPVVDQIADKVCATMQIHQGLPSSREKDLVDLVVLAVTQNVDGTALGLAISTEAGRRLMEPIDQFVVPSNWGRRYSKLAKPGPLLHRLRNRRPRS